MCDIFNVDGCRGVELRDGSHIYHRLDSETRKDKYIYISHDESSKCVIKKEMYDFLYEEQVNWFIEGNIVCREEHCSYNCII